MDPHLSPVLAVIAAPFILFMLVLGGVSIWSNRGD